MLINETHLHALAIGGGILGSGGGGSPEYEIPVSHYQLSQTGPVTLASLNEIDDHALVLPIAFMGAPLILREKLQSGKELPALIREMERIYRKKVDYLLPAEIGGANCFTPLAIASKLGYPVVDGDLLGRAYPKLNMASPNVFGIAPTPAIIADCFGATVIINNMNPDQVENLARNIVVAMGSSAAIGMYPMTGKEAKLAVVPGTVSLSLALGKAVLDARKNSENPIHAILEVSQGQLIGEGIIKDIAQKIDKGFLTGEVLVEGVSDRFTIIYQNEYLQVKKGSVNYVTTPEIIVICDSESGEPLTSDRLIYGLRVCILALPSPAIWTTEAGLLLVGPQAFNFLEENKDGKS